MAAFALSFPALPFAFSKASHAGCSPEGGSAIAGATVLNPITTATKVIAAIASVLFIVMLKLSG